MSEVTGRTRPARAAGFHFIDVTEGPLDAVVQPFLYADVLGKPAWLWLAFVAIVVALLAFDLGVLHREDREIQVRESLLLSGGYVTMGLAFGAWVWWYLGAQSGMEYLTGFMVEKTLAMDNVFVIAMVFSFFAVPRRYQHRVLFWGILGVIVLRAVMIGLGTALVTQFSWALYVFGAFLVLTGVKMLVMMDQGFDVANNPLLKLMQRKLRMTPGPVGNRFWVRLPAPEVQGGPPSERAGAPLVWWATPLFFALVLIEFVDVIFAVDSVPAIFAITQDPFIVYTSNIFAILGLRALYFALAAMIHRFEYLKYALAIVLVFIGLKIFAVNLVGKLPAWISLSVTFALLAGGVLYSLYRTRGGGGDPPASRPTTLTAHEAR
jgi:tellurite resistance protein TerC